MYEGQSREFVCEYKGLKAGLDIRLYEKKIHTSPMGWMLESLTGGGLMALEIQQEREPWEWGWTV